MNSAVENQLKDFYQRLFKVAKHFLDQSRMFTIEELQQHNDPTYDDLATFAALVASTMENIADAGGWTEERIALNAKQAALIMKEMAEAISNKNQENLRDAANRLEQMAFV